LRSGIRMPPAIDSRAIASFVREPVAEPAGGDARLPGFSIVMPSFRQAHYIDRSIRSILNQRYPDTELIVIDGGSQDGTVAILESYARQLAYWRSEPDQGQSDALNKGFRQATGEIVGWLNSDDLYLPGAFQDVARVFNAHPEIDVVYGDWFAIDPN